MGTLYGPRGDCDSPTRDLGLKVNGSVTVPSIIPGCTGDERVGVPQWTERGVVVVHLEMGFIQGWVGVPPGLRRGLCLSFLRSKTVSVVFRSYIGVNTGLDGGWGGL